MRPEWSFMGKMKGSAVQANGQCYVMNCACVTAALGPLFTDVQAGSQHQNPQTTTYHPWLWALVTKIPPQLKRQSCKPHFTAVEIKAQGVKWLTQGHTASQRQLRGTDTGSLFLVTRILSILLCCFYDKILLNKHLLNAYDIMVLQEVQKHETRSSYSCWWNL